MDKKSSITTADWLVDATSKLASNGSPSARLDAELILAHTLRKNRSYLHAHPEEELSERHDDIATARLELRIDRVPVAYIIGHKDFYGRNFRVSTATLIPRPESEVLIELIEEAMPANLTLLEENLRLVDVGTGSGILGITAKLEHPELQVTLIDNNRHTLNIAEQNAEELKADVQLLVSDLLMHYHFTADIIVANLPYVDPEWERSPETDHEPADALFAADGGLALIKKLIAQTDDKLAVGGFLILEADPTQHLAIIANAKQHGLIIQTTRDYGLLFQKLA